ncbi:MAG: VWA domain-containing protein [Acidobacteria bacterium]|nr:VWA domain-containing protein [Acidobacteriota bacterium]
MKANVCRILLCLFVVLPLFVAAARPQDKTDEDVIRVDTNLVTVPVIVSDRQNRYISGLRSENFTVTNEGQKQKIDYFIAEEAPISVAILIDTSRSTQMVLDKIKKAAKEFVKQLKPADRAMVVSFDWQVTLLCELTGDQEKLKKAIKSAEIPERFGTMLNDAVYLAVDKGFAGVKGRKAIILLTDGKDAGSYTRADELIYRMQESDALVYPVFYETGFDRPFRQRADFPFPNRRMGRGGGVWGRDDRNAERRKQRQERQNEEAISFLRELADVSAGRFFQKETDDLDDAFQSIAEELRRQYLIGFYPESVEPGRVYRIRIGVDRPDAVVRAKTVFRLKGN